MPQMALQNLRRAPWLGRVVRALALWFVLAAPDLVSMLISSHGAPVLGRIVWMGVVGAVLVGFWRRPYGHEARRLRAITDLAYRSRPPVDLRPLLETALSRAVQLTGGTAGYLRVTPAPGEEPFIAGANLSAAELAALHVAAPETAGTEHVDPDAPELVPAEALWPAEEGARRSVPGAWAVLAPVRVNNRLLGGLVVYYDRSSRPSRADLELLRSLAAHSGSAIRTSLAYTDLLHEARTDPLTGLASRRHFDDLYRRELARAKRQARPLSLAIIDVDQLKQINDTWGHPAGDLALKTVGDVLREVRAGDLAARFGGDEFALLMPDTTQSEAEVVIERLRRKFQQVSQAGVIAFPLHVSIGVRELSPSGSDLFAEADAAMFLDKQHQRQPQPAEREEAFIERTGT
jgi:diguanylate cyclase (GGDEF)-like protein